MKKMFSNNLKHCVSNHFIYLQDLSSFLDFVFSVTKVSICYSWSSWKYSSKQ